MYAKERAHSMRCKHLLGKAEMKIKRVREKLRKYKKIAMYENVKKRQSRGEIYFLTRGTWNQCKLKTKTIHYINVNTMNLFYCCIMHYCIIGCHLF